MILLKILMICFVWILPSKQFESRAQGLIVQTPNIADSSWSVYEQFTPTSTYGNRKEYVHVSRGRIKIHRASILLDSLKSLDNGVINGSLMWINTSTGKINVSPLSSGLFTGTTSQYIRGDGSFVSIPATKRQETYSGTTSGSGTYTVTFGVAYSVAPNIQISSTNATDVQHVRVTSITSAGFTVQGRNEALGLIFSNANGITVDVLVTEK